MTVEGIDWIRLYVLNDLVIQPVRVSELVEQSEPCSHVGWQFPGRRFLRASCSDRMAALLACCKDEEIVLYRPTESADWQELTSDELRCAEILQFNALAAITERGHAKWESLFEPDWSRFWQYDDPSDDPPRETISEVRLTCASEGILRELLENAHLFFGMERNQPVYQTEKRIALGVQITFWKILPSVIRIQLRGTTVLDEFIQLFRTHSPGDPELESLLQLRESQRRAVRKRVTRLSRKWCCVNDAPSWLNDSLPSDMSQLNGENQPM